MKNLTINPETGQKILLENLLLENSFRNTKLINTDNYYTKQNNIFTNT